MSKLFFLRAYGYESESLTKLILIQVEFSKFSALGYLAVSQHAVLFRRLVCLLFALCMAPAAFANALSFGPYNQGVYTGTPPFNTSGTCTDAGDDCGDDDARIRSADIVSYAWSVAASGIAAGDPDFTSVVMEQTLIPDAKATVIFDSIPAICLPPPQGTGGLDPKSKIVDHPDGSQTLVCNLGSMGNGDQKSFTVPVRPLASSFNRSTYTSTQFVYALDAAGNKASLDTDYLDDTVYEISASPAWDLIGDRPNVYEGGVRFHDMGTGRGSERGFYVWMAAHLGADVDRAGKGVSSLPAKFDFTPVLTATTSDGVTDFPIEYSVTDCRPNLTNWGTSVWGSESVQPNRDLNEHAVDSGTCSISGDPINGWKLTANDVNTLGTRYPTETINGSSLAAGPYLQMAYRIRLFVPFSQIDNENTTAQSGSINITSCLSDFDPDDVAGISNYLSGYEPGYNGFAMPDGSKSNNCTGPITLEISAKGKFSSYTAASTNESGTLIYPPMISTAHAGDGLVEPGESYVNATNLSNAGSIDLSDVSICTKFDNTTQQLAQSADVGAAPGSNAFVVSLYRAIASDWKVEYATSNSLIVDPLDKNADSVNDFNAVSGRFEGNWQPLVDYDCADQSLSWTENPSSVGIDNINLVRVTPKTSTVALGAGEYIRLLVPLKARDTFYGGEYDGQSIPVGTVLATFSTWRSKEFQPAYRNTLYRPSPESSIKDGDRVTLTRIKIDIAKSTVSPEAPSGTVTSTLAGNSIIWRLEPIINSISSGSDVAENVVITDVLPSTLIYDHACTVEHAEGVEPTTVEKNFPSLGETTLTWSLDNLFATDPIVPIVYCTLTDESSPAGTAVVNSAFIDADNAIASSPATQTVTLGQAGSLEAATLLSSVTNLVNSKQLHTLRWLNFSTTSIVSAPTIINVLPHIGDGDSLSARNPVSDFTGTLHLVELPSVTWTDGTLPVASDEFATLGTFYFSADKATSISHDPDYNTSNWCDYDGERFVNPTLTDGECPTEISDITAIKYVSNYDLETNGDPKQGLLMTYTLQANNNKPFDKYVNIFGLDSASFPEFQYVISKTSVLLIAAHSIGDFVFTDVNNNGVYDAAIDLPAPDGVTVELYDYATNKLLASVVTNSGAYLFDELEPGDFYVRIPETLFSPTGMLNGWTAAINPQAANDDNNHTIDHNTFVTSHTNSIGVQSDLITLSLTPSLSGGAPVGDEPKGENIIPIADYSTRDDFSNLTVDLALISADTDRDGILDVYELGPEGIVSPLDSDDDGLLDYLDVDSDNDGLPDAYEYGGNAAEFADTDNDGVPDHLDIDSDNDGLKDSDEIEIITADSDNDGIVDTFDVNATNGIDNNGNGLDDAVELLVMLDTDQDGISDLHDLDSDNDGLTDAYESSGASLNVDPNGDGIVDQFTDANKDGMDDDVFSTPLPDLDTDGDGVVNHLDKDSDNDGLSDLSEAGGVDTNGDEVIDNFADANEDGLNDDTAATPLADPDSDVDGIVNRLDIDSDNDGISDAIEALGATTTSTISGVDTDSDGIPDYIDLDSDNDTINDITEARNSTSTVTDVNNDGLVDNFTDLDSDGLDDNAGVNVLPDTDTNADGAPDRLELDSDGDGIPDAVESGPGAQLLDTDNDGISNYRDLDSDNDGIPDAIETTFGVGVDSDDDGIQDHLDLDSDNDGLTDTLEAGGTDVNGDGVIDGFNDANNNGIDDITELNALLIPDTDDDGDEDFRDTDSDNDTINDIVEANGIDSNDDGLVDNFDDADANGLDDTVQNSPLISPDTDNDGVVDRLDLDSDNDGLDDVNENTIDTDDDGIPDYRDEDSDGDSINDDIENPLGTLDTDLDGLFDHLDLDSDNDGIPDSVEAGNAALPVDTDNDGTPDYLDTDSDNDGIPDTIESQDSEGSLDTDQDGLPDHLDTDSDDDGLTDTLEAQVSGVDSDSDGIDDVFDVDQTGGSDADNDGIDDALEASGTVDTDSDGIPDALEPDSDNDGIPDAIEADVAAGVLPIDTDNDGIVDRLDPDSDNDGIPDSIEAGITDGSLPIDTDTDGTPDYLDSDSDNDGIPDVIEAGTTDSSLPLDTDGDGIPDYQDIDSDNDGKGDTEEAGDTIPDTDDDGIPNHLDKDSDADGIPDAIENVSAINNGDSDDDGVEDYLDTDADNDGVSDELEAGHAPEDIDNDGLVDAYDVDQSNGEDFNGDGVDDSVAIIDTDADGQPDYLDLDSDNDGIPDASEPAGVDSDNDGTPDRLDEDADNDCLSDGIEGNVDTDSDGTPDYLDLDSDNDGIPDETESTYLGAIPADKDADGIADYIDVDADNDGISDAYEGADDADGDGVADYRDLDVDNDGIFDIIEVRLGMDVVNLLDTNLDGVIDFSNSYGANGMADIVETVPESGIENYAFSDVDKDGVIDYNDLDSDNDGLLDTFESDHIDENFDGIIDASGPPVDTFNNNENGFADASQPSLVLEVDETGLASGAGGVPRNTDNDGLADFRDSDSDNDGIMDIIESFGPSYDIDKDGAYDAFIDENGDGVSDNWQVNFAPIDTDQDGIVDAREADSDGDGISDVTETGGEDANGDGVLDGFTDEDVDGVDDAIRLVGTVLIDTDNDGIPDYQDLDSDNDGISDIEEAGGIDADGDGEADAPVLAAAIKDTDQDGAPDYMQAGEEGFIHTGLQGSGCSILSENRASFKRYDPTFLILLVMALMVMAVRLYSRRAIQAK